jgi:hypothetical protein
MAKIFDCVRAGLAASAAALLTSQAALAVEVHVSVPTRQARSKLLQTASDIEKSKSDAENAMSRAEAAIDNDATLIEGVGDPDAACEAVDVGAAAEFALDGGRPILGQLRFESADGLAENFALFGWS